MGQSIQPMTQTFAVAQENPIHDLRLLPPKCPMASSRRIGKRLFKYPGHRLLHRSWRRPRSHFCNLRPLLPGISHALRNTCRCSLKKREWQPCFGRLAVMSLQTNASLSLPGCFSMSKSGKIGKVFHRKCSTAGFKPCVMRQRQYNCCTMVKGGNASGTGPSVGPAHENQHQDAMSP